MTMQTAYTRAQETFKYFYRELSWEYRRIIPALEMAMVKGVFCDKNIAEPNVEYMWIDNIEFDGKYIMGVLVNTPNYLTNVQNGDRVSITLDELCDWIYVKNDNVYGAFTVNVIRGEMSEDERREHDRAWGLDFGDPDEILLTPQEDDDSEHPMSINMQHSLIENLKHSNEILTYRDASNGTMLHYEALAGNALQVKILLQYGMDANLKNAQGMRAIDLAKIMRWESVVEILQEVSQPSHQA